MENLPMSTGKKPFEDGPNEMIMISAFFLKLKIINSLELEAKSFRVHK